MRHILTLAAVAVLVAGCTTSTEYTERMQGLVGKPISYVILKNGAPSVTTPLPNGDVIYEWRWYGSTVIQQTGSKTYTATEGSATCITGFETDNQGVIKKWYWKGRCS